MTFLPSGRLPAALLALLLLGTESQVAVAAVDTAAAPRVQVSGPPTDRTRPPLSADAVVALDGSGDYTNVQDAVDRSPQDSTPARPWVILVKPGVYRGLLYIQREKRYLHLVGTDPATTVISFNLVASMIGPDGRRIGTFRTPTTTVDADDFTAANLTFENSAGPGVSHAQALAIRVDGDRCAFLNCHFSGWQDTIFDNRGRHLYSHCTVTGALDFIFGGATSYFDSCRILVAGFGFVTAASTPREQAYGFVFSNCSIERGAGAQGGVLTHLGRPWRPFGSAIFLNTSVDDVVAPAGWDNWGDPARERTSRFYEFGSTGPGRAGRKRVHWAHGLSAAEAAGLTPAAVLAGADGWVPPLAPECALARAGLAGR